jgi:hypothetical protein
MILYPLTAVMATTSSKEQATIRRRRAVMSQASNSLEGSNGPELRLVRY